MLLRRSHKQQLFPGWQKLEITGERELYTLMLSVKNITTIF